MKKLRKKEREKIVRLRKNIKNRTRLGKMKKSIMMRR
jgi:hypothetical protein